MKKYIEIGKIVNTHGLKGELKMIYWCDDPNILLNMSYFFLEEGKRKIKIREPRLHKNFFIFKIDGIDDISQTNWFIGKNVYVLREEIPMSKGEYFQCDLIGLDVIDIDSETLYGKIFKITQTGANDVYHIKDENGKERLIPAIKDVIKDINLNNRIMLIKPLDGLFDI